MVQFKYMFLCLLLGTLWSCGQNPLKDFPKEMQEGVLKTGFQHFANFENVLVEKLLKVSVVGKNDLTMDFSEGSEQSYTIGFRLLNNFNSKYELNFEDNPFSNLKNSQWKYDAKKQTGVLSWKPSETFTWNQKYTKILIPLSIQVKKLGQPNKGSVFTVKRDFTVFVNKSYTPPKVYRIKMNHDSYVNLSDGKWYRDHLLSDLNLNFYNNLYMGEKKRIKVDDNFIFYVFDVAVFNDFSIFTDQQRDLMDFGKEFDYFGLTDELRQQVPVELIPFIKEPYYHAVDKTKTDASCVADQPDGLNKNICLVSLMYLDFVELSTDIYVKHYSVPSHIKKEHLYYKVESHTICGIYHKISADFIIHKQKNWNQQKSCYLSWDKLNSKETVDMINLRKVPITESMEIYLLKKDSRFEKVDKSKWPAYFYKLPEHIKWQLGGHQPISLLSTPPTLPVILNRGNQIHSLEFQLKDNNLLGSAHLIFEEKKNQPLIQNIPVKWTLKYVKGPVGNIWKRFYSVKLIDLLEKNKYAQLYEFPFSLKPALSNIVGEAVNLKFNVLPSLKANYIEFFNPDEDFKISTQIEQNEWIGLDVSIESQIKENYIFQSGFKENILQAMPFTNNPKNLEDLIIVETHKPASNYACATSDSEFFFEQACECSEFVYYKKELSIVEEESDLEEEFDSDQNKSQAVYMESICSYKSKLKLDTKQVNEDHQIISAYWNYNYFLNTSFALSSVSADGSRSSGIPLSIDKEYVRRHLVASESDKLFNLHIFFNLKPEINCFLDQDSSQKICQIRYHFDKIKDSLNTTKLNTDEFFFSEQGIQPDISCLASPSKEADNVTELADTSEKPGDASTSALEVQTCDCDSPNFVKVYNKVGKIVGSGGGPPGREGGREIIDKRTFLEIKCSMGKTKKGFIDLALKTSNPYIYFLDPEVNDDIKSTVFKRLSIE